MFDRIYALLAAAHWLEEREGANPSAILPSVMYFYEDDLPSLPYNKALKVTFEIVDDPNEPVKVEYNVNYAGVIPE